MMPVLTSVQRFADSTPTQITQQPSDASIVNGQPAIFFVGVNTTATYQWQEDSGGGFANLSEGVNYTGVTSNQLSVNSPVRGRSYRCIVTGNQGGLTSDEATITSIVSFPEWETNSNNWTDFASALALLNDSQAQSISFFGNFPGNDKRRSGAVAPNGKIYMPPYSETSIMVVDPTDDSTYTFGSITGGTFKYSSACLAPNGFIYCFPYLAGGKILKIDPTTDTFEELGDGTISSFIGAVLANNGCIYGIPYTSGKITKIDTADDTITSFGTITGSAMYSGGVLAKNGKIYCAPYNSLKILVIDPTDDSTYELDHTGNGVATNGGCIALNGCIYFAPYSHTKIIKVDPTDDTVTEFGNFVGSQKWRGFILGPNNLIYGVPYNVNYILRVDPSNDSTSSLGSFTGSNMYLSGLVAPNGQIYLFPHYAPQFAKVLSEFYVPEDFYLSRYVNKF